MILGIDLGTTNSLIAVWQDGAPRLIPNALGDVLTPSCVSIDADGSVLVGRAASERLQTHPDRTAAVFKRYMGSDKLLRLGTRSFRAEELSALVLKALKADAEAELGYPMEEAIITVPAYFSDAQRNATRTAGRLAGLRVERLLNEPTAAALAYGMHRRGGESHFLVFDLGGGTFDVSVLDLFDDVMEVRASAGDNFLGGEDFSENLIRHFIKATGLPAAVTRDPLILQALSARVEAVKRSLSESGKGIVRMSHNDRAYELEIDDSTFEKLNEGLLARLREPVERALRDAQIRSDELDSVVLAGGATRMPAVRRLVTRMFGRFPNTDLNPDEVVALGAAIQAGLKMKDAALEEIVMTDVCPYSLGVETARHLPSGELSVGHFDPIIERNRVVPVSRVKQYYPIHMGQREINLAVYQGEARMVRDNIKLGQLTVPLPLLPVDQAGVDVRFTYDVNGILEVEATLVRTGTTHRLVIEGNPGVLSEAEITDRFAALSELKIHPRDRIEHRTLLARAETLYQRLRGAEREWIDQCILAFEKALDSQEKHRIRLIHAQLAEFVEQMEADIYLKPNT